mmetsp:Transcript_19727/g.48469  ORF Transcript_19727/g.48469 Transcript_19727/m.48469 type:complete len:99 (+) Transcript_19727:51-347(+)
MATTIRTIARTVNVPLHRSIRMVCDSHQQFHHELCYIILVPLYFYFLTLVRFFWRLGGMVASPPLGGCGRDARACEPPVNRCGKAAAWLLLSEPSPEL